MKKPKDCTNIEEIRKEIDSIDKMVVELLGERFQYVKEIVRFKKDEEDIVARKRYGQVLIARREWAKEHGIDPDVIEEVYKMLIKYFIDEQKKALKLKLAKNKQNNQ